MTAHNIRNTGRNYIRSVKPSPSPTDYWRDQCQRILACYGDAETAHWLEDKLLAQFINQVAHSMIDDPAAVAHVIENELLKKERTRWYA